MLLELLKGNTSLHDLSRVVDFSVFNDLETEVDHSLESGVALAVTGERATLKEASEELFEYNEFREVS